MNKYQEAINKIIYVIEGDFSIAGIFFEHNDKTYDAIDILKELADKTTPKKVKHNEDFDLYGCPSCDFCDQIWGTFKKSNCCPNCGQKIDWGDGE